MSICSLGLFLVSTEFSQERLLSMLPLEKTARTVLESRKTTVLLAESEFPVRSMLDSSKVRFLRVYAIWGLWSIPLPFSRQPMASYTRVKSQSYIQKARHEYPSKSVRRSCRDACWTGSPCSRRAMRHVK